MAKNAARKISGGTDPNIKVVVKKVPAFPITAQLKIDGLVVNAKILRLNTRGLLAEIGAGNLKMGDKCDVAFEIPVLHLAMNERVVVIKQYNQWQGGGSAVTPAKADQPSMPVSVGHLIEAHFVEVSVKGYEKIASFLTKLKITE